MALQRPKSLLQGETGLGLCTKHTLISPGLKLYPSNKQCSHVQQRSYLIHAGSFLSTPKSSKSTKVSVILRIQSCFTARGPEVWPPLINSHSFMQTLTNQKSRTVCSWLLIGLHLYKRIWINQKQSLFWAPYCKNWINLGFWETAHLPLH